jgi:hypothetical protein
VLVEDFFFARDGGHLPFKGSHAEADRVFVDDRVGGKRNEGFLGEGPVCEGMCVCV